MTALAQRLSKVCELIGLDIDIDYIVHLGDGMNLQSIARIRNLGAENGMLIFLDFEVIRAHLDRIEDAGYGFSVLSDFENDEPDELEATLDMLRDWGWSGPASKMPKCFEIEWELSPSRDTSNP